MTVCAINVPYWACSIMEMASAAIALASRAAVFPQVAEADGNRTRRRR